jgi:hypothetical protein
MRNNNLRVLSFVIHHFSRIEGRCEPSSQEIRLEITSPFGPPHMSRVGAGPLDENFFVINLSVARYPTVMETIRDAPTSFGRPGKGILNHLQLPPITRPRIMPATISIILRPHDLMLSHSVVNQSNKSAAQPQHETLAQLEYEHILRALRPINLKD